MLAYDAYSAQISLAIFLMLRAYRIVVYALTAHTSAMTQMLDAVVFFAFKREVNAAIERTEQGGVGS